MLAGAIPFLQRLVRMRTSSFVALACVALVSSSAAAAGPAKPGLVLESGRFSPGLVLGESRTPVHSVSLRLDVDGKGDGFGALVLDPNPPEYDEYGDPVTGWEAEPRERK